ncbi:MAG: hypothetical protein RLZZ267_1177 [Bacillota bacterium]|jgi:uncharacterized protein YoxC
MLEWSIFAIALFFAVFVVYAIITLRAAKASLQRIDETVFALQNQMNEVNKETLELLRKANGIVDQGVAITESVQEKLQVLNPLISVAKLSKLGLNYWLMFKGKKQQRKGE